MRLYSGFAKRCIYYEIMTLAFIPVLTESCFDLVVDEAGNFTM